jgi:hypothetical protein
MKRNIRSKVFLLFVALIGVGCKTRKLAPVVVAATPPATEAKAMVNTSAVFARIAAKQVNYTTLVLKAKADLNINNKSNGVGMNIRMQKDKAIWVSVSAPIIGEVARVLVTPDSVKILNKLENTYIRKPFSYVSQYTGEEINFAALQGIFIGNVVPGTLTQRSTVEKNGDQTQVKGNLSELIFLLIFNDKYHQIQTNLKDKEASQSLSITYGDHKMVSGQEIPNAVSINSTVSNKKISVDLQYTYIGLNEAVEFPFSVPKRFSVTD